MTLPLSIAPSSEPLVVWPWYEPVSTPGGIERGVELSEADLLQHVLLLGSTGSGKTTLQRSAVRQLIRQGVSLLVLDAKQDDTVPFIAEVMRRAGRAEDLAVLGPSGTHGLPLFGQQLRSLEDAEPLAELLLLATDPIHDPSNSYWRNTSAGMVSAALTLLAVQGKPVTFDAALEFMRRWFVNPDLPGALPKAVTEVLAEAHRQAARAGTPPQLLGALDHVEVWRRLDVRTRSNLQSCLLNVLRPLMAAPAGRCFGGQGRPAFNPAQVAREGKVCVVSVNALTHSALAKFFLRLARKLFFDAVQSRGPGEHPLAGLIADELPLILQPEDVDQLSTLRSQRCFVLAATQGLAGLDQKIGAGLRRALLVNFGTVVFLRTREVEADQFAGLTLGLRPKARSPWRERDWGEGTLLTASGHLSAAGERAPVCPPGGLGRLEPHQGFVVKSDGTCTPDRVWFVPWFEMPDQNSGAPVAATVPVVRVSFTAPYLLALMRRQGLEPRLSAEMVAAAARLDAALHQGALDRAATFFWEKTGQVPEGLDTLPAAWLAGLPGILWSLRRPRWTRLPYRVESVACKEGVLLLNFAGEPEPDEKRFTLWDEIRAVANRALYPSRWRSLLHPHRLALGLIGPPLDLSVDKEAP
ncbi:MAG TPA: DUF87 domain-containing protein [Terracidiphilus sp.]|nr:DUF87 domain-containing protein [Terracidiphilus sp.]